VDNNVSGVFNAVNPAGKYTMADLLEDSQAVSGTTVDPLWVSEEFLYENDLAGSRSIPIWSPTDGENGGSGTFSGEAARAAGLHNRPERETARNVLTWWDTQSEERRADMKAGLAPDREAELIAAWKAKA
jgi:2'-hydroxyisoflavone reductase